MVVAQIFCGHYVILIEFDLFSMVERLTGDTKEGIPVSEVFSTKFRVLSPV